MNMKRIYLCDDSIDGIFTAIYLAWNSKYGHSNIKIEEKSDGSKYSNIEMFSEYIAVDTDYSLAKKVSSSIKNKISDEAYEMVYRVALSDNCGKADLIYRFLILGFSVGSKITQHLSNDVVNNVFRINKNVNNEAHHLFGFIRFSEQENGLLTSIIHPQNNVLTLITPHFADRLPQESFLIYDENRKIAAFHVPGNPWILAEIPEIDRDNMKKISFGEDEYRDLWKAFYNHIAIKERINPKLQRSNLPLRFRRDMTEFK
ncbi:MAG: TIGR03915 family putative DNA repair protein [Herbinix sp.]|nr:TIGR03915 family putative DNA repair protein [Herbinix sp.]